MAILGHNAWLGTYEDYVKVLSPCLPAVTAGNIMVFIPDTGFVKKLESLLAVVVCDI